MEEIDTFIARLRERQGQMEITIPIKVCEYGGYKSGDLVKIMIKKKPREVSDNVLDENNG